MFCELAHWRACAKCHKIVIRCFVNLPSVSEQFCSPGANNILGKSLRYCRIDF